MNQSLTNVIHMVQDLAKDILPLVESNDSTTVQQIRSLLIHAGGSEALLDDAIRIAKHCQMAGVHTELEIWNDMIHVWQLFAAILPIDTCNFVRDRLTKVFA